MHTNKQRGEKESKGIKREGRVEGLTKKEHVIERRKIVYLI